MFEDEDDVNFDYEEQQFQHVENALETKEPNEFEIDTSLQKPTTQIEEEKPLREENAPKNLSNFSREELFEHILKQCAEKQSPPLEFLDAAFECVRLKTDFFKQPNRGSLMNMMDKHFAQYQASLVKEIPAIRRIPKNVEICAPIAAAPAPKVDTVTAVTSPQPQPPPGGKKLLGEDPVKKLQELCIQRLSGENEAIPVNNLLQSLSQEYTILKETYGKKWLRWLTTQDFLNVNTDENMVTLLPEYNTGVPKKAEAKIVPTTKAKEKKRKSDFRGNKNGMRGGNRRNSSYIPRGRGRGRGGRIQQSYPYSNNARPNQYPYSNGGPPSFRGPPPNRGFHGMRGRGNGMRPYRGRGRGFRGRGRGGRGRFPPRY